MTKENLLRLYKHFVELSEGRFNERTFDSELKAKRDGEEAGTIIQGKMNSERRQLIMSDAKRNRAQIEAQYPNLHQALEPVLAPKVESNSKPNTVKKKTVRKA